jgi:hypothetical protein
VFSFVICVICVIGLENERFSWTIMSKIVIVVTDHEIQEKDFVEVDNSCIKVREVGTTLSLIVANSPCDQLVQARIAFRRGVPLSGCQPAIAMGGFPAHGQLSRCSTDRHFALLVQSPRYMSNANLLSRQAPPGRVRGPSAVFELTDLVGRGDQAPRPDDQGGMTMNL